MFFHLPGLFICIAGQYLFLVKCEWFYQVRACKHCGKWCWIQGGHRHIAESNGHITHPSSNWNEYIMTNECLSTAGEYRHWTIKIYTILYSKNSSRSKLNIIIKVIWHQFAWQQKQHSGDWEILCQLPACSTPRNPINLYGSLLIQNYYCNGIALKLQYILALPQLFIANENSWTICVAVDFTLMTIIQAHKLPCLILRTTKSILSIIFRSTATNGYLAAWVGAKVLLLPSTANWDVLSSPFIDQVRRWKAWSHKSTVGKMTSWRHVNS